MDICVVGAGYVGIVTAACFADLGNTVYCVEADAKKLQILQKGESPIYEPGLEEKLYANLKAKRLICTGNIGEAADRADIYFIAVGTPMGDDGNANMEYVMCAAEDIGENLKKDAVVIIKSTVPVGSYKLVRDTIEGKLRQRGKKLRVPIVSNPEFLKEGSAIKDCMRPDRVIIGADDQGAIEDVKELYAPMVRNSDRFICMDNASAEMSKYASNAMLATRISFMNEIAAICEETGANINSVRLGMGSDSRIGYSFLYAGCGYGGSCFPKDVQALIYTAAESGCTANILEQVQRVNKRQKGLLVEKAKKLFGEDMREKKFCVWGLAFKPNTDDLREAPSIEIIKGLLELGAEVKVYDPEVKDEDIRKYFGDHERFTRMADRYEAVRETDALLLVTEWREFSSPDFNRMKELMRQPIIIDGRNQYDLGMLWKKGFEYYCIGQVKQSISGDFDGKRAGGQER